MLLNMSLKKTSLLVSASALILGAASIQAGGADDATWTGNIGVHSKYILRGITNSPENSGAAIQGGFDYEKKSGFYVGYWGSNLGYRSTPPAGGPGFENDVYIGKKGKLGAFGYDIGLIQYYYIDVNKSDLTEFKAALSYGPFALQVQYLLRDGAWGNSGDQYWTLNYTKDLPKKFKLETSLGYYIYDDSVNTDGLGATTENSAFRHLNLKLSHPIGKTGADMYTQYIVGGKNRVGVDQDDTMVFGITYNFNL